MVYNMSEEEYRLEEHLMATIEQIYTKGNEPSVCIGSLRMVLHVLQRHGENLRSGWAPILRLLRQVPRRHQDSKMQALAFQSMELVCRDYLDHVTPELLPTVLEVVALYAKHSRDMNLSLTAVNLLWHAADLFGRQMGLARQQITSNAKQEETDPLQSVSSIPLDQSVPLLKSVLELLRDVSLDSRTVIRNSGVETLMKVVNTQGAQMPLELWVVFMEEVLLPLLKQIHLKSRTSSNEELDVLEVGDDGDGRQIKGMVHHSMNTAQKQWDQTLKRALLGLTGMLCKYFPVLSTWVRWPTAYEELIQISEQSLIGERKDVTTQAINLLCSILRTYHSQPNLLTDVFWKRALKAIDVGIAANTVWKCQTHPAAREEIAKELFGLDEGLYAVAKSRFDLNDHHMLFEWINRFGKCPYTVGAPPPKVQGNFLPQVQKIVCVFFTPDLTPIPPLPVEEAWLKLIDVICGFLSPQVLTKTENDIESDVNGLSDLWIEEMIQVLITLYCKYMSWRYQCITMAVVIEALGRCMKLRTQERIRSIWRNAAQAFNNVINQGVPAISRTILDGKQPPEQIWENLVVTLQNFFFAPIQESANYDEEYVQQQQSQIQSYSSGILQEEAELVMSVLDSLCDSILSICLHSPQKIRVRFVELLDEGVARGYRYPEPEAIAYRFSHACMRKMFVLCGRGSSSTLVSHASNSSAGLSSVPSSQQAGQGVMSYLEVAQITLPMMIIRCDNILREYAAEENEKGVHMETHKKDLVRCIFEVLQELQISWDLVESMVESWPAMQKLLGVVREHVHEEEQQQQSQQEEKQLQQSQYKQRIHLLMLYDALCRCVISNDAGIRETVMELLLGAGDLLGLVLGEGKRGGVNQQSSDKDQTNNRWFPLLS
eukprot:TRINITY_DN6035_c0_g3_i1.p1 TRINITY_DN6035_c0_g3~~TRINITY_DN6035_c0_g3_i1.p1  ORF type:complete len:1021 (+),score=174.23 TRINITY_DN6035_c0_g3_i1:409-3063(+)